MPAPAKKGQRLRRRRPAMRPTETFIIQYRGQHNEPFTSEQIQNWYNQVNPEGIFDELRGEFGNARVLDKLWMMNGTLMITVQADTPQQLQDAIEYIADPDHDGNEPMESNGQTFLIVNRLLMKL